MSTGWRPRLFLVLLNVFVSTAVFSQEKFEFLPGGTYDPEIPTPEEVLGYPVGERHTLYRKLEQWLQTLARNSDRVMLDTYGESFEGRGLFYLVISSPRNLARLEEIKSGLARLADPRLLTSSQEVEELIADLPAVVWLAYTVHGNEASGTEAAIQLSYQLAAGTDSLTARILDELVVVIDPLQNPDGHERFVHWVSVMTGVVPDPYPAAMEHTQPWPGGRTNHYFFDLNRDWFLLTQPESEGKVQAFLQWNPQVFVDLHEMGSNNTYFFAPPMSPVNLNVPAASQRWWEIYGKANAAAFDSFGWPYYVRESFDEFYPGYGVSWPTLTGAIGMTYEQASSRGLAIRRNDDTILTLRDGVHHHFTTSFTTCLTTADFRKQRLRDYYEFRRTAIEEGKAGPMREILLLPGEDPATANKLVGLLVRQGIEVRRAREAFRARNVHPYVPGPESREFPPGTYLVSLAQPQKRLAKAILEPHSQLPEEFIEEERRRKEAKERSRFYDITAWSLPLTMGVEAYWSARQLDVVAEPVPVPPVRTGQVVGGKADYAYVFRYRSNAAAKALARLLYGGYRVYVTRKAFRLQGEFFPPGSLILWVKGNRADLFERLSELAQETGADFYAFNSGWVTDGVNLGSPNVRYVKSPKILVAADDPTSPYSVGAIRYLFDQHYGIRASFVRTASLANLDLSEFDVIILPDARSGSVSYKSVLGKKGIQKLSDWIRAGGVIVAIKEAARFATDQEVGWSSAVVGKKSRKDTTATAEELPPRTPGAILRVKLQPRHYLTFGYGAETFVLVNSRLVFQPSVQGKNLAVFASRDSLRISGFVWEEALEELSGAAYLIEETLGSGRVILYADDPNFRASWDRLTRLFLNAIFFAPSLK
jgi:hypothetical protein